MPKYTELRTKHILEKILSDNRLNKYPPDKLRETYKCDEVFFWSILNHFETEWFQDYVVNACHESCYKPKADAARPEVLKMLKTLYEALFKHEFRSSKSLLVAI